MDVDDPRLVLDRLIRETREDCASLSRMLGRNAAYVQQYIRRGTPRRLAERDRAVLARYFGVSEASLGAPPAAAPAPMLKVVPRLDVAASAGPGAIARDAPAAAGLGFSESWLRRLAPIGGADALSMIAVSGTSMLPTLAPDDDILVDAGDAHDRLREGIYVLRIGDELLVKRLVREGDGFAVVGDNPQAPPVTFADPADVTIVGRVVWAGRKL